MFICCIVGALCCLAVLNYVISYLELESFSDTIVLRLNIGSNKFVDVSGDNGQKS